MKYSEFKREIEALGLIVTSIGTKVCVETNDKKIMLAKISTVTQYNMRIGVALEYYHPIHKYDKDAIAKLIYELSITPIVEREDEKYYLKIDGIVDEMCYLNYNTESKSYIFDSSFEVHGMETKFTHEEIKNLPDAFKKMLDAGVLKKELTK